MPSGLCITHSERFLKLRDINHFVAHWRIGRRCVASHRWPVGHIRTHPFDFGGIRWIRRIEVRKHRCIHRSRCWSMCTRLVHSHQQQVLASDPERPRLTAAGVCSLEDITLDSIEHFLTIQRHIVKLRQMKAADFLPQQHARNRVCRTAGNASGTCERPSQAPLRSIRSIGPMCLHHIAVSDDDGSVPFLLGSDRPFTKLESKSVRSDKQRLKGPG